MDDVGAILLTGGVGALIAIWGVITQRVVAARAATLSHLAGLEADEDFIKARQEFIKLTPEGLAEWGEPAKRDEESMKHIRLYLNHFELIEIGIQLGIIDNELYKRYNRSTVIAAWRHAAPFVYNLRKNTNNDALFTEFEELARRMAGTRRPQQRWWRLLF